MKANIAKMRRPLFGMGVGAVGGAFFVMAYAAYIGAITTQESIVAGGALSAASVALIFPFFAGRMESLADMGNVGDIGGIVGSVIALGVAAIILLTFSVPIIADVDGIAVQSKSSGYCELSGQRFDRVVDAAAGGTTGSITDKSEKAWASVKTTSTNMITLSKSGDGCAAQTSATAVFTPKGDISVAVASNAITNGKWQAQSASLGALSGGSLIGLLFGAMGILIPAGALGGLAYFGAQMVQKNIGGNTLAIAIGATVSVIVVASLLPELFSPLDTLFVALDGNRFYVYSQGIGRIASVLGNFLGIALVGGLIGLGAMLWKGARRGGGGQQMM